MPLTAPTTGDTVTSGDPGPVRPDPGAGEIVMGLAGTVDVELAWSAETWSRLAREEGIRLADLDPLVPILDVRSALRVTLALMARGRGNEVFLASSAIAWALADRFPHRVTLGGTNIRAAILMAILGIPATVAVVDVDPTMRRLLPPGVVVLRHGDSASLDPHLIVQYPADAVIELADGEIRTPAPNRVILTNDPPNRALRLAPGLAEAARRARILVLSSLNAIQEADVLAERLAELGAIVASLDPGTLVLWEEAGYHVESFRARVTAVMAPLAHVYSMNEDELGAFVGRTVDPADVDDVARALAELRRIVPARTIVVHSSLWALAVGDDAEALRPALRGGITAAGARYLHGDALDRAGYDAVAALDPDPANLARAGALADLVPGLVVEPALRLVTADPTTIGLGDTFVGGFVAALARPEPTR
ncbi:ADP-dependent glucokinase/phosphofructokinase [Salana multivorans]|uniref:ADP-dependent glucokinase/phosphofructokinase n=1 Tax=Salana multivorans TaxID=120377 RepID=UPI000AF9348D|nr:ADP-dependent glucokinase/phosphofructokinase [Salana multivorans]